jgi:nucleolar complex protein 3
MFLIYFKVLKTNSNFKLIPCVLEGLSKFAHLISLDFFDDLVSVLHEMVESDVCAKKKIFFFLLLQIY